MTEYPHGDGAPTSSTGTLSIPFLVVAAVLCGVGLFGLSYWLLTQNWIAFASLLPLFLGAYMLFLRGTGPDRA